MDSTKQLGHVLLRALLAEDTSLLQLRPQRRLGLAEGDGGVGGVVLAGGRLELGGGVVGHLSFTMRGSKKN